MPVETQFIQIRDNIYNIGRLIYIGPDEDPTFIMVTTEDHVDSIEFDSEKERDFVLKQISEVLGAYKIETGS